MPAENITLTARWEEKETSTVSFEISGVDGMTSYGSISLCVGDFIPLPDFGDTMLNGYPLLGQYTLVGWSVKYSTEPVPQLMPEGIANLTLVATFAGFESPVTAEHTVYYETGCTSPNPFMRKVFAGDSVPRPDPGNRDGYQFVGWYQDTAFTQDIPARMQDTDLQLYARWIDLGNPTPEEVVILTAMGYEFPTVEIETPIPTEVPTPEPTETPVPTEVPTPEPTETPVPTEVPTPEPTETPVPTEVPTPEPTETPVPTEVPTLEPTKTPSYATPGECA